jgi:hypothetical protein
LLGSDAVTLSRSENTEETDDDPFGMNEILG